MEDSQNKAVAVPKKTRQRKAKEEPTVVAVRNPYELAPEKKVKQSATYSLFKEGWYNYTYENMGDETFEDLLKKFGDSSTWVYIAVKRIADAIGQIPVQLQTGGTDRPQIFRGYDKGLQDLLNRPNPWQSWFDFAEAMVVSLELTGNAFIEIVKSKAGRPIELYVLNPARMTILPSSKNYIDGYVYSVNGRYITFDAEEIMHIKYHHPSNDFYGLSPLTAAAVSIEVDKAALEWNQTFLLRGAYPAGALETENEIGDDELKRLQRQIRSTMQRGKDQAGRILVLAGGLKYHPLHITPKDADWLSSRRMSRDEILAIFGVPFAVAGLFSTEQTTARSAGVEQQIKQFYRTTIFSKMDKILGVFNRQLVPLFRENVRIVPNYRSVPALQEEVEQELTRAMALKTLVTAGVSLNKALGRLYPDIDKEVWGDVAWMPSSVVPIDSPSLPAPSGITSSTDVTNTNDGPPNPVKEIFLGDEEVWDRIVERVQKGLRE